MKNIKKSTVLKIKAALKTLKLARESCDVTFKDSILESARDELAAGVSPEDVVKQFMAVAVPRSWESQEISRALKQDKGLLEAGLAIKAFRRSGERKTAEEKAATKAKKKGGAMSLTFASGEDLAAFLLKTMSPSDALELVASSFEALEAAAEAAEKAATKKAPAKKAPAKKAK
jgi:hypothetical protein